MSIVFSISQHYKIIQKPVEWEVLEKTDNIQGIQESWKNKRTSKGQ